MRFERGDNIFDHKNIHGIDVLKEKIPPELQYWHYFGTILELNYCSKAIDEFYCDYTNIITLLLTDHNHRFKIELSLYNITGDLRFDMLNGLFSGFAIDDLSYTGSEDNFHLYSFEQDNEFDLYCKKIRAVLL